MGARESAETRAGLALIDKGQSVRKAAAAVGVAPSTLQRAKDRRAVALEAKLQRRESRRTKE